MTDKQYYARGCTALLDAIGKTISHVSNRHKHSPDNEVPAKTMVVITTDGYENASREFSLEKIREMIERQKVCADWEFLFLGANIDAVAATEKLSIDADRAATFFADGNGMKKNFEAVNHVAYCIRCNEEIDSKWKDDIERYIKTKR